MNQHLQAILTIIQQDEALPAEQKAMILKSLKDAGKELEITAFKLDRTEKVKRTTAILLEETIEELEQKRAAVEAQNRELEIESSLEKVRTVAMSMNKADDMLQVCRVISEQLEKRNIKAIRNVQTAIFYPAKGTYMNYEYYARHQKTFITETTFGNNEKHAAFAEEMQNGNGQFFELNIRADEVKEWIAYQKTTNVFIDDFLYTASSLTYYWQSLGPVALGVSTYEPLQESDKELFKRFSKVFELAYRRYLDIEKAEAQAKEAQIETALERVRSRSIGMRKSEEMKDIIQVVYDQLVHLNILVEHAGFIMDYKKRDDMHIWLADQHAVPSQITIPYFDSPHWNSFREAKEKGLNFFANQLGFDEKNTFYNDLFALFSVPDKDKDYYFKCPGLAISTVLLDNVGLYIENFSGTAYSDGENATLVRFGKVFQQTYQRFLDLQKAEEQAREAKIEAALERVRSRTMAMHQTSELQAVIHTVHNELLNLNLSIHGGSFVVINDDVKQELRCWGSGGTANTSEEIQVPHFNMPFCTNLMKTIQSEPGFFTEEFSHNEKKEYFTKLFQHKPWSELSSEQKAETLLSSGGYTRSVVVSTHTAIFVVNHNGRKFTGAENEVLKRFATVFEQTYTRFLDLKKAEAQAREAQIEAALERVRSRTLAMQKSDELTETAAVLFKQLILLGIAPIRLYIGIVKEAGGHTEFWITDEDGGGVRSAFEVNLSENPSFNKMLIGWKERKKSLVIDIKENELQQYLNYLNSIQVPFSSESAQKRRMQYVAYFNKGFIGMASPDEQPLEMVNLLERFAYVFNLTFTRFSDLQLAEAHALQSELDLIEIRAARRRAEEALSELQITQKQLIQSEKMASLGELTAGIAHEIQNPLNFVNNFSEVSNELLDEMMEEVAKGNYEEVKAIADDVKQNLAKINHHGRRADGIVKGMLQHSRSSSATKEPTDINALADEYLRLAYHGLRAKDKSFNATLETDYDQTIGKIELIPQDIGRVILNLITNAFYAVDEKKKQLAEGYNPTVSVGTKKLGDSIEIRVQDNGNGIPQHVIDKIFQPFFTTKPTGQGTGLGLSLAYDIIKAHGGELRVETKEGEGTTFTIQLPQL